MALFSEGPAVGLLLTDERIYGVEITPGRGGEFRVAARHDVATPKVAYADGVVLDADLLGRTLRDLWQEGGFTSRRVIFGLPPALCSWRRMDVPPVAREEQAVMIRNELQPEGLFDPSQQVMDFLPLALPPGEEGVPVTVVMAEEPRIHAVSETLAQAGLGLEAVEPLAVGAIRLAALCAAPGEVATVAVVSRGLADLILAEGGTLRFQRRVAGDWLPAPLRRMTFLGSEAEESGETTTLDDNALAMLGEVRRSVVFCQRLAPEMTAPEKVYLVTDTPELHAFVAAAAVAPSPMQCHRLDTLLASRLDLGGGEAAAPVAPADPHAGCYLLALGLALRRIPQLADGNRMDLSQTDGKLQLSRSAPEIRTRALAIAGTWLAVNVALAVGLASVAGGFAKSARTWKAAADAAAADDPRVLQRLRVERAQAHAAAGDAAPDRWLDLLGAISTPDIQVTSLQLNGAEVNLTAAVGNAEVVVPFTGSLERYLPLKGNPTVSVSGDPQGNTTFSLSARLRGPIAPAGPGADSAPKSGYQAGAAPVEVPDAVAR
jgi:hypothetical protein